jgi:hypothetical protein
LSFVVHQWPFLSPKVKSASEANFSDLSHPSLNSAGQIAFRADVTVTGLDTTNDKDICATDDTGTLQLIVCTGDRLEVAPGDFCTLSDLNFTSALRNSDGRSSGFNNVGQLAFWANFTYGSQGVFVSNKVLPCQAISISTARSTPPTTLHGATALARCTRQVITTFGAQTLEPRSVPAAVQRYPPLIRCRPPYPNRRRLCC